MCRVLIAEVIIEDPDDLEKVKILHMESLRQLKMFVISGKSPGDNPICEMFSEITIQLEKKIRDTESKEPAPKERINLNKYPDIPRKVSDK